jgi:hypothetical protein
MVLKRVKLHIVVSKYIAVLYNSMQLAELLECLENAGPTNKLPSHTILTSTYLKCLLIDLE